MRAEAEYNIGYAYAGMGALGPAIEHLERAVMAEPDHPGWARSLHALQQAKQE